MCMPIGVIKIWPSGRPGHPTPSTRCQCAACDALPSTQSSVKDGPVLDIYILNQPLTKLSAHAPTQNSQWTSKLRPVRRCPPPKTHPRPPPHFRPALTRQILCQLCVHTLPGANAVECSLVHFVSRRHTTLRHARRSGRIGECISVCTSVPRPAEWRTGRDGRGAAGCRCRFLCIISVYANACITGGAERM